MDLDVDGLGYVLFYGYCVRQIFVHGELWARLIEVEIATFCTDFCETRDLVYVDSDLGYLGVVVDVLVVLFLLVADFVLEGAAFS